MNWDTVGEWLKQNAGTGAMLVGSLLTGNAPGAVAAGISLISSATGTTDPAAALQQLQTDPATMVRLKELAFQNEASIRDHIRVMEEMRLKDLQDAHQQQQKTIQTGDNSNDEYVRRTRPKMARQSWYSTMAYIFLFEGAKQLGQGSGASWDLALVLMSPAGAYLGFRTFDKISSMWAGRPPKTG